MSINTTILEWFWVTDATFSEELKESVKIKFTSQQQEEKTQTNSVPFQLCPKCKGDGHLLRNNPPLMMGTSKVPICDVCGGDKIIPMLNL
jgi:hypothetical protein